MEREDPAHVDVAQLSAKAQELLELRVSPSNEARTILRDTKRMTPEQPPDRMPAPPDESLSDDQKRALSEFAEVRGYAARGPFIPLLRSPRLLTAARVMGDYLRFNIPLPPSLRELAILVAARKWSQPFEWNSHYAIALEHGLAAEVADAIGTGRRPQRLSADEQIVYDFCTELLDHCRVGDETYERASSRFGEAVIVDIVGLVGYYTFLAMMLNVARTPLPADAKYPLPSCDST